jgi:hypothetical protein
MKRWIRKLPWPNILSLFLLGACACAVWGAESYRKTQGIREVLVKLVGTEENQFVEPTSIRERIQALVAATPVYSPKRVHRILAASSYLRDPQLTVDASYRLLVTASIRKPIARVVGLGGSAYIEQSGKSFPWSAAYSARAPLLRWPTTLADTSQPDTRKLYQGWVQVLSAVADDSLLSHLISEIQVSSSGEGTVYSQVGNLQARFGTPDRAVEKLATYRTFVEKVLTKVGWGIYTECDLRYRGQVVARKL